jgi:hypothetical protein
MNFKQSQVDLLVQDKPFIVLQNVKDKYPNISSQSVVLSQIKRMYLSDPQNRLPEYETTIKDLINKYPDKKEYLDFSRKSPYHQDKIQKKIRNGKIVYNEELDKIIEKIPLFNKNIDTYIKLPSKDAKQLRQTQTRALNNKHHNIKIIDGDKLMTDLLPLLNSENSRECIPALLLATGRRQNELVDGTLSKSKCGPYFALFKGQSKTGLDIERDEYDIPLLSPFNIVDNAWKRSKSYFENSQDRKVFKAKIRNISRWLKKNSNFNVDKLHEFRSIYALICYELFPTGKLSQMAYISNVLGETSINIASHYNSIKVENIKNLWIPCEQKYNWIGGDSHLDMIIPTLDEFIMKQCMEKDKKKITKTLIGRICGKSQNVVKRFYDKNELEIEKFNKLC